jgi:uncharacterized protein
MYEMGDHSWLRQPRAMSGETARLAAQRIGEHVRSHGLDRVAVILHGGEPLLAGHDLIRELATRTRAAIGPGVVVEISVQTNGVGLTDAYLRLFEELDIHVGVSVDGNATAHDRHRQLRGGGGSYAAVATALGRLRQFPRLYSGLLAVVDLDNDPVETYQSLIDFGPPKMDFLLPHGTWDAPPPGRMPESAATPYADWLIAVFDHWYRRPQTRLRLFEEIMRLLLGGASDFEAVGLGPARMVVIETDGSIEQADTLKAAFDGAPATGLHLGSDQLDSALRIPQIVARQIGERALAAQCRACEFRRVCGGGMYAHRYRHGTGFANPSVYCPDLMALIAHIRERMMTDLPSRLRGPVAT